MQAVGGGFLLACAGFSRLLRSAARHPDKINDHQQYSQRPQDCRDEPNVPVLKKREPVRPVAPRQAILATRRPPQNDLGAERPEPGRDVVF